jgi:hypothetical protein
VGSNSSHGDVADGDELELPGLAHAVVSGTRLIPSNFDHFRIESFLSLGSIMAFRSDRFPAGRTFFEELFLDEELADLALEDRWHVVLKVLLPSADLGRGDVVLLGDLLDRLLSLERLGGDTGFGLGG